MKYEEIKQTNDVDRVNSPALDVKTKNNVLMFKPDEATSWWTEAKFQLAFSIPIVVQTCSQQTMMLTDLIFVGRLGANELAVIGISGILWNIMWYWLLGVASALDTLGSQSLGAGNPSGLRSWTVVSAVTSLLISIPMILILVFAAGPFALYGLGSDYNTAQDVASFCSLLAIGVVPGALTTTIQKYLTVRGMVAPVGGAAFFTLFLNLVFNQLFIHGFGEWEGLGMLGSPIATSTSRIAQLFALLLYCRLNGLAVHGDDPTALSDWNDPIAMWKKLANSPGGDKAFRTYAKLGMEGGVMLVSEAMSFDITCIYAALLGKLPLDAHTVLLNICGWTYLSGPLAFGIAASIRVGTELGAQRPKAAQSAATVSFFFGIGWMIVMSAIMYVFRFELANAIVGEGDGSGPSSADVVDLVCQLTIFAALFQTFDGLLGIAGGVLRGCGHQGYVAKVNIATLWGVGVVGGYMLTFVFNFGIFGVWSGLALGVATGGIATSYSVYCLDWNQESTRAVETCAFAGSPFQSQRGFSSPCVARQMSPLQRPKNYQSFQLDV